MPATKCLKGLSAFPLTPMDADGVVDTDHLQRLVARLRGADSVGVLGSTGSYMYLSAEQRARAVAAAVEAAGDTPVLAGIGALRQDDVLAHARAAEEAGAAAVLLAPVSYLPLTEDDFTGLVEAVAGACGLPICLYNNPGTTHFTMRPELVARLSEIPRVAAVKTPAPADAAQAAEQHGWLSARVPDGFVLGYSGDALIPNALLAGGDAWYSVIAGTLPELALEIWQAGPKAAEVHARHAPLWSLFARLGGIRVVPEIAARIGLGAAPLPLPLRPLPAEAVAEIDTYLQEARWL